MASSKYRTEHVSSVPSGWRVRTVKHGRHRVRVAFAPKKRGQAVWQTPPGMLVSVLHPLSENPCELRSTNPAELLVLGANPPRRRANLFGFGGGSKKKKYEPGDLVKIRIGQGNYTERVWAKITSIVGQTVHATLDNEPTTGRHHLGDRLTFSKRKILEKWGNPPQSILHAGLNPHGSGEASGSGEGATTGGATTSTGGASTKTSTDKSPTATSTATGGAGGTSPATATSTTTMTVPGRNGNPAELLVVGANPPITLRNPFEKVKDSKGRTWYTGITASGRDYMAEAYPVSGKKIKRAGRPVYARGASEGEAYDRLLEKIEPNPAKRTRGPAHNPAAETIYEAFSGVPCKYVTTDSEPHMPAGDYAQLGDPGQLLSLFVKPLIGGPVQEIAFKQDRPVIVTDRTARQIYFVKGDQDISDSLHLFVNPVHGGGVLLLGEGRRIDYKARKEHVAKPEQAEWKHEFGEENGRKPRVLFDTQHKRLLLEGGDYRIDGAWIRN